MHLAYPLVVAALLFSVGVYGVLARRNAILVLMSVELMLNAVNLNLVTFDVWSRDLLHGGQVLTLFTIVIAAAELGLGLAIVLLLFRNRRMIDVDRLRSLHEEGTAPAPIEPGREPEPGPDREPEPGPDREPEPGPDRETEPEPDRGTRDGAEAPTEGGVVR